MSAAIQALASRIKKLSREELLSLSPEDAAAIDYTPKDARCAEEVASFEAGPLYWLTNHTKTENPQYEDMVPFLASFPRKAYFVPLFQAFMKKSRQLYTCKSRSLMTSWSAAGYAAWLAQYRQQKCPCNVSRRSRPSTSLITCTSYGGIRNLGWQNATR